MNGSILLLIAKLAQLAGKSFIQTKAIETIEHTIINKEKHNKMNIANKVMSNEDKNILIECIRKGVKNYLNTTYFGMWSLWKHGETGRIRADRIIELIDTCTYTHGDNFEFIVADVRSEPLPLLMAILNCSGWTLKYMIALEIQCSGIFKDTFSLVLLKYSYLTKPEDQIIQTLINILECCYDIDRNSRSAGSASDKLLAYIDGYGM
jgi:hypothetical protein